MTSKTSKILAENEKHKNNQVINQNISELWNRFKIFKAKFHEHNVKLEQFTLKVLKLSFFSNPQLEKCNNRLKHQKSRKTNVKTQLSLIKKAISIHLRSLQIEQLLFRENQYLKELFTDSYEIAIKERNSSANEIKNIIAEDKCFKSGLEYIFHELEYVSNKTKFKTKPILNAGNDNDSIPPQNVNDVAITKILECPQTLSHKNATITDVDTVKGLNIIPEVTDLVEIITGEPEKFNFQIELGLLNLKFDVINISQVVNNNLNLIIRNISKQSSNKLLLDLIPVKQSSNTYILDVKPIRIKAVLDIASATEKRQIVQKAQVPSVIGRKERTVGNASIIGIDTREKADIKSLKWMSTLIPNIPILNFLRLFFPLSFLYQKALDYCDEATRKKNSIEFKDECVHLEDGNLTCAEPEKGENVSKDKRRECINLSEIKTVEFYDIPSSTDMHDYTVSWVEQQNERDFYYIKQTEKMENNAHTNSQPKKRKSIMKRSTCSSRQDNFKDYLQSIITYSEEFYNKRDSSTAINPPIEKKSKRVINFPSSSFPENNYAGKMKNKYIPKPSANHNKYKLPKMPDMNKTYQIVFQQNMPQGFSLKFVKSTEKDISTLIVRNGYPSSKQSFPRPRLYKKQ